MVLKMKTFFTFFMIAFVPLWISSAAMAVPLKITPEMENKAIQLFSPDEIGKGPYDMKYKADIRMHNLGYRIINYTVLSDGQEVGVITRIESIIKQGVEGSIDLLVRYDDSGKVKRVVSLKKPEKGQEDNAVTRILHSFVGLDMEKQARAVNIMVTALAQGSKMSDVSNPPPPPKNFVLDLRQKMLTPGAKLPTIKAKYLDGKGFDTSAIKGKLIMVFTAASCVRCDAMINTVKKGIGILNKSGAKKNLQVAYIIGSQEDAARSYAERLEITKHAIAEPTNNFSKLLQVPFKPYALMFDKSKLVFPALWEREDRFLGILYMFLNDGKPPKGLKLQKEAKKKK